MTEIIGEIVILKVLTISALAGGIVIPERVSGGRDDARGEAGFFAQLMDHLPPMVFERCVARYGGNHKVKSFTCMDQYLCMAYSSSQYTVFRPANFTGFHAVSNRLGRTSSNPSSEPARPSHVPTLSHVGCYFAFA